MLFDSRGNQIEKLCKTLQGRENTESASLIFIPEFKSPLIWKEFDRLDEMNSPELYLVALINPCFPTFTDKEFFSFITKHWERKGKHQDSS